MGVFDFITGGSTKEFKTQLYFYDDDSFEFKKRLFKDACMVEEMDGKVIRAWKHFFSTEIRFDGYKNLKPGNITIGCGRDFILDLFNKVPETTLAAEGGKPKKDEASVKKYTSQIAESQRYKVMNKPLNMLLWNKITIFLGTALLIEMLIWLIKSRG